MRPDQDVDLAFAKVGEDALGLGRAPEPRDHLDAHGEVPVPVAERVPVLLGEDGRRREHQRLLAVDRDRERCANRDLGLAEADVAADEPVHRVRRLEVLLDGLDRALLILRLAVRELGLEPLEPLVVERVRGAGRLLPLCVEADQVARELVHAFARARLEPVPRLAAELRQRRRFRVGTDVARDLADLLVRHVQPVVAAKREEEIVARDVRDRLRLEAEQLADAVVLVDDEVAGAQVGERLQRAAAHPPRARRTATEDLRVGKQDEREVAPDEAAARRSDREHEARARSGSPSPSSSTRASIRRSMFWVRSASPLCGNATTTRLPALTSPESSFSASARPRAAIAGFCASNENGWPDGSGSSSLDAFQVEVVAPELLEPDAFHLAELPHQVGRTVEDGHEILGNARSFTFFFEQQTVVGIERVEPALGRRIDDRVVDRVQRALRERRERAHLLDLVAEELDADRLAAGRREDVDQAAAHRELPAVVDALDALVARERERLRQALDARLGADHDADRLGPLVARWDPLGERRRGGPHETARGEHVERARPLADEVRRRGEPRLPAHAAARQERDPLGAQVPARRLGEVARVGVLGRQRDEPAPELLVERRDDERQRRVRDARADGKRLGELAQALAPLDLAEERVQHGKLERRTVHDERRDSRPAGCPWYPRDR